MYSKDKYLKLAEKNSRKIGFYQPWQEHACIEVCTSDETKLNQYNELYGSGEG